MRRRLQELTARHEQAEAGFTLVEMLVAMMIFGILSSVVFGVITSTGRATTAGRQYNDLNEEARVMLNRMSRELREASRITAFTNPGPAVNADASKGPVIPAACSTYTAPLKADGTSSGAAGDAAVTFEVDFSGDGAIQPDAADPERLTYYFDNVKHQVLLQAAGETFPILASNVDSFKITPMSRLVQYDEKCTGQATDGLVQWSDLDADGKAYAAGTAGASPSGVGNGNGKLDVELGSVDSLVIEVTVLKSIHRQQTYRTQVDLRNRPNQ